MHYTPTLHNAHIYLQLVSWSCHSTRTTASKNFARILSFLNFQLFRDFCSFRSIPNPHLSYTNYGTADFGCNNERDVRENTLPKINLFQKMRVKTKNSNRILVSLSITIVNVRFNETLSRNLCNKWKIENWGEQVNFDHIHFRWHCNTFKIKSCHPFVTGNVIVC